MVRYSQMERKKLNYHKRACHLLGIGADKIRIVSPAEYRTIMGHTVSNYLGVASYKHNTYYVRRSEPLRTYVHELLHILFKNRPHWWIYCVSWKLTGQKILPGRGYNYGYGNGFFVDTIRIKELPSKAKLIKLCQKAYNKIV